MAITGGSGSGKSTVAEALLRHCAPNYAVIFHEDGYYWPRAVAREMELAAGRSGEIDLVNFDDPASKDMAFMSSQLAQLKAGQSIAQPVYDYDRHDRSQATRTIEPCPLIILEGIHALSVPAVRKLIDLSVYVDTPDDLRLARRIRRDVLERERTVASVLEQYLSTVRAAHYQFTYPTMFQADLVIADEGLPAYGEVTPSEAAITRMLAPMLARLQAEGVL